MDTLPESLHGERVLNVRQGAELLGVSVKTLRRLQWAGKLPVAIQVSDRKLGWRLTDLRTWLASRQLAA